MSCATARHKPPTPPGEPFCEFRNCTCLHPNQLNDVAYFRTEADATSWAERHGYHSLTLTIGKPDIWRVERIAAGTTQTAEPAERSDSPPVSASLA